MTRAPLLLLLVLATACVQAPPVTSPDTGIDPPDSWSAVDERDEAAVSVAADWWRAFEDPGLAAAVEEALAGNTDLLAAAARVRQAEAAARIAGADLAPQLSAGLSGSRRRQNFVGFPIPGGEDRVLSTTTSNYGVNLTLSWEVDLWGRLSAQARQGLAGWQASRADLAGVQLSIAGQTAKAWFAIAEASRQLRLARNTVDSFARSEAQVRRRFEQGVRPPLDLRLARAQVAAARSSVAVREQQLDAAIRQLEVLLGRYPARELAGPADELSVPPPVPAGLPAELVRRRPDVVAAERRLVAAGESLGVARASLYPRLSLTGSAGTSSDELTSLVDGDFSVWSLVGNLVAPLLQGGRLRANVDLAAAGVDERLATYVGTALRAYAEVESGLFAERQLAQQEAALAEAARESRQAGELALDRYRNGLTEYVTVLEAQRRTFDAESALLTARRLRLDARVDLILALGGGFEADAALDIDATPTSARSSPGEENR